MIEGDVAVAAGWVDPAALLVEFNVTVINHASFAQNDVWVPRKFGRR